MTNARLGSGRHRNLVNNCRPDNVGRSFELLLEHGSQPARIRTTEITPLVNSGRATHSWRRSNTHRIRRNALHAAPNFNPTRQQQGLVSLFGYVSLRSHQILGDCQSHKINLYHITMTSRRSSRLVLNTQSQNSILENKETVASREDVDDDEPVIIKELGPTKDDELSDTASEQQPPLTDLNISKMRRRKGRYFEAPTFGSGLVKRDQFKYRARSKHFAYYDIINGRRLEIIKSVEDLEQSNHGITLFCKLKNRPGLTIRVEHFDIWFFDNGPEAVWKLFNTTQYKQRYEYLWTIARCRQFMVCLAAYNNGDPYKYKATIQKKQAMLQKSKRNCSNVVM